MYSRNKNVDTDNVFEKKYLKMSNTLGKYLNTKLILLIPKSQIQLQILKKSI